METIKAAIRQRIAEAEARRQQLAAELSFYNGIKSGLEELLSVLERGAEEAAALEAFAATNHEEQPDGKL